MQGFVDFGRDIGLALAVLLPAFCYLAALGLFMTAGWGFWRQSQPDNPFRGKPWLPVIALVLSGVFASFDRILTMANISGGSTVTVGVGGAFGYVPPATTGGVLGATPVATVINVIEIFQHFFQAFGAMMAFFAVLTWWAVMRGTSRRGSSSCLVQFVFGVMLINVLQLSTWLSDIFRANT